MGLLFVSTASATVFFVALFALSWRYRGRIRARLASISLFACLVGLIATAILFAFESQWGRSDYLSLVGILVSVVFTIITGKYVARITRLRVGIVIPSLRPFHQELRKGLAQVLDSDRFELIDPYVTGNNPEEDLSTFIPTLQEALTKRSDVLVICAPAVELANSPALIDECVKLTKRGGHVFFIESIPSEDVLRQLRFVTTLISDSQQGAILQSQFIINQWKSLSELEQQSARVLIVPGPAHSRPAAERLSSILSLLEDVPLLTESTLSWTTEEGRRVTKRALEQSKDIRFICCGNDDIARGAMLACFDLGIDKVNIVGHDGLYESIVLIADPFSPLTATIRIPPSAFGFRIGSFLDTLPSRWALVIPGGSWFYRNLEPESATIAITRANLVTMDNAPLLIASRQL